MLNFMAIIYKTLLTYVKVFELSDYYILNAKHLNCILMKNSENTKYLNCILMKNSENT